MFFLTKRLNNQGIYVIILSMKTAPDKAENNLLKPLTFAALEKERAEILLANYNLDLALKKSEATNTVLQNEFEILKHNYAILQRALFGKRSEKLTAEEIEQFALIFNKAEDVKIIEQDDLQPFDAEVEKEEKNHKRKACGRKPLSKNLPRVEVLHDLTEQEKVCACGCALSKIGEESSEQLDYVPATLRVIKHIRLKYACNACEETVKRAAVADKPIAKANATSGLLAHILVSKFEDHLPCYRQSYMFDRAGAEISRATLCNWMMACGDILEPLVNLMKEDIVKQDYVCSDETKLQVLSNTGLSYMWVHISGERDNRIIVYDYRPNRNGENAEEFLDGFKGYHQCDGYSGYNGLYNEIVIRMGCWAHARRKFYDVMKLVKTPGLAHKIIQLIRLLYEIEREALGLVPKKIKKLRQQKAVPVLREIKRILNEHKELVPPKGKLGQAITYVLNNWAALNVYVKEGRLRIDNNDCERIIRPYAIGRKNWLFCATQKGAKAGANIISMIQTCKANDVNTYEYLKYVLQNIKAAKTDAEMRALLPYNINKDILKCV